MAWRRPGDKPLSESMVVSLLKHICVDELIPCLESHAAIQSLTIADFCNLMGEYTPGIYESLMRVGSKLGIQDHGTMASWRQFQYKDTMQSLHGKPFWDGLHVILYITSDHVIAMPNCMVLPLQKISLCRYDGSTRGAPVLKSHHCHIEMTNYNIKTIFPGRNSHDKDKRVGRKFSILID